MDCRPPFYLTKWVLAVGFANSDAGQFFEPFLTIGSYLAFIITQVDEKFKKLGFAARYLSLQIRQIRVH